MSGRKFNFQKPEGSASKFSKPRSQQNSAKKDANTTVSCSEPSGFGSSSSRNLNSTVRRNLDITMVRAGSEGSLIKPKFGPSTVNNDVQLSLAYSEYLQAVMKKSLARKTAEEHKNKLENQIIFQSEKLYNLQQDLSGIVDKLENIHAQSKAMEILNFLPDSISNINSVFEKLDTKKSVLSLCSILEEDCNLVKFNNIKPIKTQEEYDNLMKSVSNLASTLEKVLNSGRNIDEVTQLREDVKRFHEVKEKVEELHGILAELRKKSAVALISNASDMFARLGGYE